MLFEKLQLICRAAPQRCAVVAGGRRLTYAGLDQQATRLARFLVAQAGVSAGALVAIYGPRTVDTLVGMLGIMKSGAAYTVVEADGRHAECQHRLLAMAPAFVLCESTQVAGLRALGLNAVDATAAQQFTGDTPLPLLTPAHVAYVLFTSGSTGTPKGVAVTHGNVAHYVAAVADRLGIDAGLRYAHVGTLAADLGNTSVLLSLVTGGCLHLLDGELRKDPAGLRDYLIRHEIQFLKITPSHWRAIFSSMTAQHHVRSNLSHLVLGGEVLPVTLARLVLQSGVTRMLVNHYGPTETTVGVTTYSLLNADQLETITADSVPIGLPLGDTVLRVRGDDGSFAQNNATGELYIGGPSVSAGYVGDAEGSKKSFVMLGSEGRFYKTGDQVCIDESGLVHFLGRVDRQVKVNGYRVELEHIESVLRKLPGIQDAAVFFPEIRGKSLIVAALRSTHDEADFDGVRRRLTDVMPEHMIPKRVLRMDHFPRNENGKTDLKILKQQVLQSLHDELPADLREADAAEPTDLAGQLRRLWRTYLRGAEFGDDDDFFELGGDSLDAIQLIADIQVQGHQVTAKGFLNKPTIRGLMRLLSDSANAPTPAAKPMAVASRHFSAAQAFFFCQDLAQPDHHNQALLLACGVPVDVPVMREAVARLVEGHASLRTAYRSDDRGRIAHLTAARRADMLSHSFVPAEADSASIEARLEREAQAAQEALSLADGSLFRAHVFKFETGADQLLLVAHHVAVDVISWRILVADLSRLYSELQAGRPADLPRNPHTFWDWAAHVHNHEPALKDRAARWLAAPVRALPAPLQADDPANTEGAARTLWLGFSPEETRALTHDLTATLAAPFHIILLAALAQVLARTKRDVPLCIDVESHGRVVFDDDIDISRVVGWHTSTFPLSLQAHPHRLSETVVRVARAMHEVPDLGMAFGVLQAAAHRDEKLPVSAPVCFNYLGDVHFNHDPRFPLKPSAYPLGRARAAANQRGHQLKFTARLIDGKLIADLSYPQRRDDGEMRSVMQRLKSELMALLGRAASPPALVAEAGTRTGLLSYVPRHLLVRDEAPPQALSKYAKVLLTGAAGYMGVHVLMELLQRSQAEVVCMVRAKAGVLPADRLRAAFDWYFPESPLADFGDRVSVIAGDLAQAQFGLESDPYEALSADIDAIYHFAADTRLFGPEEEFRRNNVDSVRTCITFAQHRRPKDLHCMSTLAVSGVNPGTEPLSFSEDSMDVGQEFQNFYESSKYEAECLVKNFEITGHGGFIYRSGNVSAHSRTARFQRNAADNRFVQFLAACVKVGQLPKHLGEPIVLSPVDTVAAGIVAISMDTGLKGGIFHVDSSHEIPMHRVFESLQRQGLTLQASTHDSFAGVFGEVRGRNDSDLALGYFWAMRKPRNVRYRHERTQQVLQRLGLSFEPLSDEWLQSFARSLAQQDVFGAGQQPPSSSPIRRTRPSRTTMETINQRFKLSRQHVKDYRDAGFVLLKKFFSDEMVQYLSGRVNDELTTPTDRYQKGFDRLRYDLCAGDEVIYELLAQRAFREAMAKLCDKKLFFTQGVGFGLKKNVSTGFNWHIESQSFGFHRTEDYATTLWTPLHPINTKGQRGGMRYVPRSAISGEYMYSHVDPAVFRCLNERIESGGIGFDEYVALRDEPLNSSGMNRLLEYFAIEDDFELGDALLFDKYVIHRSVVLEEGPLEIRDAFSLRFICEDSRYDRRRAHDIEIPRNYFKYTGPTKFHLEICENDGDLIADSPFFDGDREQRRIGV
jgi:amino acid adenylation domain-containing protein/thioester reductase-like protein/non-ribosomal peptide synthase protein (TIGR01720 family)